jgi:hypothetical protein
MKKLVKVVAVISSFLLVGNIAKSQDTLTINREGFSIKHLSTWKIETEDNDYNPDSLFTLGAIDDEAIILFFISSKKTDPTYILNEQKKSFEKKIKIPVTLDFSNWGHYNGKGAILQGKIEDVMQVTVRLFAFSQDGKTVLIVEFATDETRNKLKDQFKLIENSFTIKK